MLTRYHLNWIYFITPSYSYKSQNGNKGGSRSLRKCHLKTSHTDVQTVHRFYCDIFSTSKKNKNKKQIIPSFNLNFVPLVTVGHCLMKAERCRVWMFISRLCTGLHSPRSITYKRSVKQHTKDGAWRPRALRQRCWEAACYFRQMNSFTLETYQLHQINSFAWTRIWFLFVSLVWSSPIKVFNYK